MISGRQALADMEQAIASTRADEGRLDGVLANAAAEAQRLRQEQAEAFRALARMRLDAIEGEATAGRLESTERRALQLMEAARRQLAELAERRKAAAETVARIERDLQAAQAAADAIDEEIDGKTAATEARSAEDPAWRAAKARVEEAERIVAEAEKKAVTAETDRSVKGAPYEADPLFMYLWNIGFGTAGYRAGPFVRFFDRKVAALVGFAEARPNYAMLTEIPVRLRQHVEAKKAETEAARAELAGVERRLMEADGIGADEERLGHARAEVQKVQTALKQARDHLAAVEAEHGLALEGTGKGSFGEAVDMIAAELARDDLQALYRAAFKTPDPRDEKIVKDIERLGEAIERIDREIAETRRQAREIAGRRTELETVRDDFRRHGYDSPQVSFGNERAIGEVIGGIIGGVLRSPDLWRVLRDAQSTRPRRSRDGFGGGARFPLPGGFDGGFAGGAADRGGDGGFGGGFGGRDGGGGGGGGNRGGGGGFSTGGGF